MVELVHHLAVRDCSSVNHVIYSLFERRYFAMLNVEYSALLMRYPAARSTSVRASISEFRGNEFGFITSNLTKIWDKAV